MNLIIGQLLDKCCIRQAHRLARQFNHPHEDLAIILTTIQLAIGLITANEMMPDMKRLVAAVGSVSGLGGVGSMRGRTRKMSDAWRGMMSRGMLTRSASSKYLSHPVTLSLILF